MKEKNIFCRINLIFLIGWFEKDSWAWTRWHQIQSNDNSTGRLFFVVKNGSNEKIMDSKCFGIFQQSSKFWRNENSNFVLLMRYHVISSCPLEDWGYTTLTDPLRGLVGMVALILIVLLLVSTCLTQVPLAPQEEQTLFFRYLCSGFHIYFFFISQIRSQTNLGIRTICSLGLIPSLELVAQLQGDHTKTFCACIRFSYFKKKGKKGLPPKKLEK